MSFFNPNQNMNSFPNDQIIPQNPIFNHPNINNNLNNNINRNNTDINIVNNPMNLEAAQMSEEQKKEIEVENDIRDRLKCYICLSKVKKPKMCKFCSRLSCSNCINSWLSTHNYCGICKKKSHIRRYGFGTFR